MNEEDKTIKIFLAEDHEIVCYGLKIKLSQQDDLEIIGQAADWQQALELSLLLKPHVILLDLDLTDESIKYITQLKQHSPNSKILIFNICHDKEILIQALGLGIYGVIYKEQSVDLICKAIRHVHRNHEVWVDRSLTTAMWKENCHNLSISSNTKPSLSITKTITPLQKKLTAKETKIARLSAKGLCASKIGEKLFISEKTVRNNLTSIYRKLNVKNQIELAINKSLLDELGR